jgi:hypothetical protein
VGSALQEDNSREGRDDHGFIMIQAIAAPQNLDKVEAAVREEFARLAKEGVTEQEVRDAVAARLVAAGRAAPRTPCSPRSSATTCSTAAAGSSKPIAIPPMPR